MLSTHTVARAILMIAANASLILAGDQITLHGMDSGYFVMNSTPQAAIVLTNDFAEGVGSHLGKYTLVAREQINTATGAVTEGAFIITAAGGDTIRGAYTGQASFQPASATWTAEGRIEGGTGRFAGASGTVTFTGSSDLSTCQSVAALTVCSFTETTAASVSLPANF
jgi:hypothetical protein